MKVLAGMLLFFGLGFLLASAGSYWSARPYGDGLTAVGTVVDYIETDDNKAGIHSVVTFTDDRGQPRRGYVDNAAQLAPGTTLDVFYPAGPLEPSSLQSSELVKVRAPSLNEFGVTATALAAGAASVGLSILVYQRRKQLDDLGTPAAITRSGVMAEPQALLLHLRDRLEPLLGEQIQAAFPVVERRPVRHLLIPVAAVCTGIAVAAIVASSSPLSALAGPVMGCAVLMVVIVSRRNRDGAVAVTANEYILVEAPLDSQSVDVLSRLSRSTPLARAGRHRGAITGGPIPFASNHQAAKQWHFTGATTTAASIDYLTVNTVLRSPRDQPFASADSYLASVSDLLDLVNHPVVLALPLRANGALRDLTRAFVAPRRASSLLVSPSMHFVIDHGTPVRQAELVATIPRRAINLEEALAEHGRRIDGGLRWVQDLADHIYLQDLQTQ